MSCFSSISKTKIELPTNLHAFFNHFYGLKSSVTNITISKKLIYSITLQKSDVLQYVLFCFSVQMSKDCLKSKTQISATLQKKKNKILVF